MNRYDMTRHKTLAELCVHKDEVIDDLTQQLTEAQAHIEAVTGAANKLRKAIDEHYPDTPEFSTLYVEAAEVIDSQTQAQSLALHDKAVIERAVASVCLEMIFMRKVSVNSLRNRFEKYIEQLRNQANTLHQDKESS